MENENANNANPSFSPFDPPVKEVKKPVTDNTGMKYENISDKELDGNKGGGNNIFDNKGTDIPKDAPEFTVPDFDKVPNSEIPPLTDSPKPGSGGSGSKTESTKIPDDFQKEFTGFMAKWLVDLYFKIGIIAIKSYTKVDKSEFRKLVDNDEMDPKFERAVDEHNRKLENQEWVTEDEKKFIIEPLKYFIEVKGIKMKPEYMFLGGLVVVSAAVGFRAYECKKDTKDLIERMLKDSAKTREAMRQTGGNNFKGNYPPENVETFSGSRPEETFSVEDKNKTYSSSEVIDYPPGSVEEVDPTNH